MALRILFGVLAIGIALVAHVYVYQRLVHAVTEKRWTRLLAGLVIGLLSAGGIAARIWYRGDPDAQTMALAFPLWLGFLLYVLMALVTIDLARAIWNRRIAATKPHSPERRQFISRAVAASAATAAGGMGTFGIYRSYSPAEITEVPVKLAGLPKSLEGFTIVQLTDIHIGAVLQQRFMDDLVARANAAKGDLVAITGDLVDGTPSELGGFVSRLRNLQSRHGTYFVTGNHDHYSGADAWCKALEGMGVNTLRNRRVQIGQGSESFDLLGVEDWGGPGMSNGYDLGPAIAGRDPSRASVLLAHQPNNLESVANLGISLQLSGHTHGGQLFPGNFVAQLIWGTRAAGLSKFGNTLLYTSRGCGFVGPPMRVGSPPEIVKVVLLPA